MQLIKININDLKRAEYNPRKELTPEDKEYQKIKNSIQEFGYVEPIIINKDKTIIGGHQRLSVLKDLGYNEVDCIVVDIDKTKEKALNIALNKITGEWDLNKLGDLLLELDSENYDLELTGFDNYEIENILAPIEKDDEEIVEDEFDIELPEEPKAKLGDIYQLGNHRLMCGDSTKIEDVEKLMNGNKADMVFTDPPYGIDIVQGKKVGGDKPFGKVGGGNIVKSNTYSSIIGDETTDTARKNYEIVKELSDNQIIFGGNYFTDFLKPSKCWCVWDKQNTGNFADVELAWTSFDKGAKIYHYLWNGLVREGSRDLELSKRVHPTQKPVGMIINILKDFTKENDSIIDCFGGSGSTLIACEQLNRNCYMMELDPHYIDVIIQRWEQFTGKKAIKIN